MFLRNTLEDYKEEGYKGGYPNQGVLFPKYQAPLGEPKNSSHDFIKLNLDNFNTDSFTQLKESSQDRAYETMQLRKWANKEIKYKRNNLEARILKLCDLREQLQEEKKELLARFSGVPYAGISGSSEHCPYTSPIKTRLPYLMHAVDMLFFDNTSGDVDFSTPSLRLHDKILITVYLDSEVQGFTAL